MSQSNPPRLVEEWARQRAKAVELPDCTCDQMPDDGEFYAFCTNHARMAKVIERSAIAYAAEQVAQWQKTTALCQDHQPSGGTRATCILCGLLRLSAALSEIDYACGEFNDMHISHYDVSMNEQAVIDRVKALKTQLIHARAAERETIAGWLGHQCEFGTRCGRCVACRFAAALRRRSER